MYHQPKFEVNTYLSHNMVPSQVNRKMYHHKNPIILSYQSYVKNKLSIQRFQCLELFAKNPLAAFNYFHTNGQTQLQAYHHYIPPLTWPSPLHKDE